jgi:hypothetical protein
MENMEIGFTMQSVPIITKFVIITVVYEGYFFTNVRNPVGSSANHSGIIMVDILKWLSEIKIQYI